MKYLTTILLGGLIFGQDFNSQNFNSQFNTNLDVLQREVARQYTPKDVAFYGNKYYYEEPQPAYLELFNADKPLKVLTNYNLIDETFEYWASCNPKFIFATVAQYPSKAVLSDGTNAHCTIKDIEWWESKIEKHFKKATEVVIVYSPTPQKYITKVY